MVIKQLIVRSALVGGGLNLRGTLFPNPGSGSMHCVAICFVEARHTEIWCAVGPINYRFTHILGRGYIHVCKCNCAFVLSTSVRFRSFISENVIQDLRLEIVGILDHADLES